MKNNLVVGQPVYTPFQIYRRRRNGKRYRRECVNEIGFVASIDGDDAHVRVVPECFIYRTSGIIPRIDMSAFQVWILCEDSEDQFYVRYFASNLTSFILADVDEFFGVYGGHQ